MTPAKKVNDADKVIYCACMAQVTRRLRLVGLVVNGQTTGDASADSEFACLQLRKILEQVAYASLAASREHYAELRPQIDREWKAKQILERLGKLNSDFFPKPVSINADGPNRWKLDPVTDGYLTKEDFVFLYDKCSEAIHDWNPYRSGPRVISLERPLVEWARRIERLLSHHWIRLIGEEELLVIQLDGPDGKAHVLTASPTG